MNLTKHATQAAWAITLLALPLLISGCLRRTEAFEVLETGQVRSLVIAQGDEDDIDHGDAMPSQADGWRTLIEQVPESSTPGGSEGKETKEDTRLMGVQTFAAGSELPDSYAQPGTARYATSLRFPTTIRIEQRPEGTYYHFRRTYQPRPAARIAYLQKQAFEEDEKIKVLMEKDPEELTPDDRKALVDATLGLEEAKTKTFLDQAFAEMPDLRLPQDAFLLAREQAGRCYHQRALRDEVLALFDNDPALQEFESIAQEVSRKVEGAFRQSMRASAVPTAIVDLFVQRYEIARDSYEITEDVSDEEWQVFVKLPGKIIAHNAWDSGTPPMPAMFKVRIDLDITDDAHTEAGEAAKRNEPAPETTQVEVKTPALAIPGVFLKDIVDDAFESGPDRCGWRFNGREMRDHAVVLMATSFVPAD